MRSAARGLVSLIVVLLLAGFSPSRLGAEIYTWVDQSGVIHLANRPRFGAQSSFRPATVKKYSVPSGSISNDRRYDDLIRRAAERYDLGFELVKAVIHAESRFDPHAVSNKGAQGLMQLMPETARGLGVSDVFNPEENILGGSRYLKLMLERYNQDLQLSLAAYNAGPAAVDRTGGVPPYAETRNYIRRVKSLMQRYGATDGGGAKIYRVVRNGRVLLTNRPLP